MALELEPVVTKVVLEVDGASVAKSRKVARDTGKKIDQDLLVELELNSAKLERELALARSKLRRAVKEGNEEAEIDLRIDVRRLSSDLTQAKRELRNLENTGDRTTSRLQRKFDGLAGGVKNSFSQIKSFLIGVFSFEAIRRFGSELLRLGSDAEEVGSKFNTVFSGIEDQARDTFNNIADNVGRSRLELQEFGSGVADIVKPLGFATDEALALSENVTKLAIDLASFNNVQDEQAINAVTSALTGEREALKSLGIVISEADLKQEAYNSGLAEQGAELTKQQKTLATYNLLLKNSTDAQGDAARTATSFANQLKALRGAITDAFAEAGQAIAQQSAGTITTITSFVREYGAALLTAAVETAKTIGSLLGEVVSGFNAVFGLLSSQTGGAVSQQQQFAIAIARTLLVIRSGINIIVQIIKSLGIVFGDVFGGIGLVAFNSAKLTVNAFRDAGQAIIAVGRGIATNFTAGVQNAVAGGIGAINGLIDKINSLGVVSIGRIAAPDTREFVNLADEVTSAFSTTSNALQDFQDSIRIGLDFKSTLSDVASGFDDVFLDIAKGSLDIDRRFKDSGKAIAESYDASFDDLSGLLDKYAGDAGEAAKKASGSTKRALEDIAKAQEERLKELEDLAKKTYENIGDAVKDQQKRVEDINDSISDTVEELKKLGDEASNVSQTAQDDLADRFLEVQEALEGLDPQQTVLDSDEIEERNRLLEEQAILQQNLSDAEVQEAQRQQGLSETEKILEARDQELLAIEEKKLALEEELLALEESKSREELILRAFAEVRKEIERGVTEDFAIELNKRLALVRQFQENGSLDLSTAVSGPRIVGTQLPSNITQGSTIVNQTNNNNFNDSTSSEASLARIERGLRNLS